jgi:putative component of toxin-antitoxin plasmid stabilization module
MVKGLAMKDIFPEFYQPEDDEFNKFWNECLFVLDTNVLLGLYRYTEASRNDLFSIFENPKIASRLWLPHHVGLEFQRRRLTVILTQKRNFEAVEKAFFDGMAALNQNVKTQADEFNKVNRLTKEPLLDVDRFLKPLNDEFENIKKRLFTERAGLRDHQGKDVIRERLDKIVTGKVGQAFTDDQIKTLCEDGKKRFKKKIPPGYRDYDEKIQGKGEEGTTDVENRFNQFGDLIIWKQIIEQAKSSKQPIIYVTTDLKEDWFEQVKGYTVGPRVELIREIRTEAGVGAHIYPLSTFYKFAKEFLKQEIRPETVDETGKYLSEDANRLIEGFRSSVYSEVRSCTEGAKISYSPSSKILTFVYEDLKRTHAFSAFNIGHEVISAVHDYFGNDVQVEFQSKMRGRVLPLTPSKERLQTILIREGTMIDWLAVHWAGQKVSHLKYGNGAVVGIVGNGPSTDIRVMFENTGLMDLPLHSSELTSLE